MPYITRPNLSIIIKHDFHFWGAWARLRMRGAEFPPANWPGGSRLGAARGPCLARGPGWRVPLAVSLAGTRGLGLRLAAPPPAYFERALMPCSVTVTGHCAPQCPVNGGRLTAPPALRRALNSPCFTVLSRGSCAHPPPSSDLTPLVASHSAPRPSQKRPATTALPS